MRLEPIRTGVVIGLVIALWHAGWAALVAGGLAKALIDFILRMHFLQIAIAVAPFNMTTAIALIAITFGVGFAIGLVLALVWNVLQPKSP